MTGGNLLVTPKIPKLSTGIRPEVADVTLWPLAVLHAVYLVNRIPREDTGRSPLELFSRKTWPTSKFQDLNVWGCPAYVLDSFIASGRQIPRWQPRSSRSQYVGSSAPHGHGVPLIMNLDTGKVTAQYHVVFDNWFQTIDSTGTPSVNFDHEDWLKEVFWWVKPLAYLGLESDKISGYYQCLC